MTEERLRRLLGPRGPELTCEECFAELPRYVERHTLPEGRLGFEPCIPCKTADDCAVAADCFGLRAHLEGCPACREEYETLSALVEQDS